MCNNVQESKYICVFHNKYFQPRGFFVCHVQTWAKDGLPFSCRRRNLYGREVGRTNYKGRKMTDCIRKISRL